MKKTCFFLLAIWLYLANPQKSYAVYPPGVYKPPDVPLVMGDYSDIDWNTKFPELGAVGGWWDWGDGAAHDEAGKPLSPAEYILDAQKYKITLENGQKILKPIGIGPIFDSSQSDLTLWRQEVKQQLQALHNILIDPQTEWPKPEYHNLAAIIAPGPRPKNTSDCGKGYPIPNANCDCGEGCVLALGCVCTGYGEITDGYPASGGRYIFGNSAWGEKIIGLLDEVFPKFTVWLQPTAGHTGGFAAQSASLPHKSVGIKNNGWKIDPDDALITQQRLDPITKKPIEEKQIIGGTYGFAELYYEQIPIGFEPGDFSSNDYDAYWGTIEVMSHHPDFLDIQDPYLNAIAAFSTKPEYNFDLRQFMRDYLAKTREATPGLWVVLRDTSQGADDCFNRSAQPLRICYEPWRKNFSYWLYQLDELSQGKTVVMSSSQLPTGAKTHPYGMTKVRRTDQNNNNPYMFFDIDNKYVTTGRNRWQFRITYLDKGTDKFSLEYKNLQGQIASKIIQKNDTYKWVDYVLTINDADFSNQFEGKADFRLDSRDADDQNDGDEIIHRVVIVPFDSPRFVCLQKEQGNANCDPLGLVNEEDVTFLLSSWQPQTASLAEMESADFNHDQKIDECDLAFLLSHFTAPISTPTPIPEVTCLDICGTDFTIQKSRTYADIQTAYSAHLDFIPGSNTRIKEIKIYLGSWNYSPPPAICKIINYKDEVLANSEKQIQFSGPGEDWRTFSYAGLAPEQRPLVENGQTYRLICRKGSENTLYWKNDPSGKAAQITCSPCCQ